MNMQQIIDKTRRFLADPEKKIWQDDEIQPYIASAVTQYCIDSRLFRGTFSIYPEFEGVYKYPDDFIDFLIGWNSQSEEITVSTQQELFEKRQLSQADTGKVLFLYGDISNSREYKLYPVPDCNSQTVFTGVAPQWGVLNNGFGVVNSGQWGTASWSVEYDFIGEIVYCRRADLEEIQDYMPVVLYALFLIYNSDFVFSNPELAAGYLKRYKQRIAAYGSIIDKNTGLQLNSRFF